MDNAERLAFAVLRQVTEARLVSDGSRAMMCLDDDGTILIAPPPGSEGAHIAMTGTECELGVEGILETLATNSPARRRFEAFFPGCRNEPMRLRMSRLTLTRAPQPATILDAVALPTQCGFPPEVAAGMVTHMNDDHIDALRDYCRHAGVACEQTDPVMLSVDPFGFFVRADAGPARFEFPDPCASPLDVRKALVAMAKQARAGDQ